MGFDWNAVVGLGTVALVVIGVVTTWLAKRYEPNWHVDPWEGAIRNLTGEVASNVFVNVRGAMIPAGGSANQRFASIEADDVERFRVQRNPDPMQQGAIKYCDINVIWTRAKTGRVYQYQEENGPRGTRRRVGRYCPKNRGFHEPPMNWWQRLRCRYL